MIGATLDDHEHRAGGRRDDERCDRRQRGTGVGPGGQRPGEAPERDRGEDHSRDVGSAARLRVRPQSRRYLFRHSNAFGSLTPDAIRRRGSDARSELPVGVTRTLVE